MALAAGVWLALIAFAPLLPVPVAGAVYLAGSLICHQRPDRSFHFAGAQLPVCARCAGIYAGAVLCLGFWVLGFRAPGSTVRRSRVVLVAAAIPTVFTVVMEWLGQWAPSNLARALAGAPLGAAVAFVVADVVAKLHYEACAPQRPIAPRPPPTPI